MYLFVVFVKDKVNSAILDGHLVSKVKKDNR